jgi:hypothetical protein
MADKRLMEVPRRDSELVWQSESLYYVIAWLCI